MKIELSSSSSLSPSVLSQLLECSHDEDERYCGGT